PRSLSIFKPFCKAINVSLPLGCFLETTKCLLSLSATLMPSIALILYPSFW
ncbi:MAG: hypothetical protein ACI952_001267, partial [Flavobacteriales bacterium]